MAQPRNSTSTPAAFHLTPALLPSPSVVPSPSPPPIPDFGQSSVSSTGIVKTTDPQLVINPNLSPANRRPSPSNSLTSVDHHPGSYTTLPALDAFPPPMLGEQLYGEGELEEKQSLLKKGDKRLEESVVVSGTGAMPTTPLKPSSLSSFTCNVTPSKSTSSASSPHAPESITINTSTFKTSPSAPNQPFLSPSSSLHRSSSLLHLRGTNKKLVLGMVGLPARGKTYIAQKVSRYLNWSSYLCQVFNIGVYRRRMFGAHLPADWFDPTNATGVRQRNECALAALDDMFQFFQHGGQAAVFDGTNTTAERREMVRERVERQASEMGMVIELVWIESIVHDNKIVEENIRETKLTSPDYDHLTADVATADFKERIKNYGIGYETLPENTEQPYVKLIDAGRQIVTNRIVGYLMSKIVLYLHCISPRSHGGSVTRAPIYISRHGESQHNVLGLIGGDSDLSPQGLRYAKALAKFIEEEGEFKGQNAKDLTVWTSTMRRTIQTASSFHLPITQWRALIEIQVGVCFPEVDTRILTDAGMQFLDEIEARIARGEKVLYGCYDVKNKALCYSPGKVMLNSSSTELVELTPHAESQRWGDGSGAYGEEWRPDDEEADVDGEEEEEGEEEAGGDDIEEAASDSDVSCEERSLSEVVCTVCHINDNEDVLLLCERCSIPIHTYCLKPALDEAPKEEWFCVECTADLVDIRVRSANWEAAKDILADPADITLSPSELVDYSVDPLEEQRYLEQLLEAPPMRSPSPLSHDLFSQSTSPPPLWPPTVQPAPAAAEEDKEGNECEEKQEEEAKSGDDNGNVDMEQAEEVMEKEAEGAEMQGTRERTAKKKRARRKPYSKHVSLRVTADHKLYVQLGNESISGRVAWSKEPDKKNKKKMVTKPPSLVQAADLLSPCECPPADFCLHRRASVRMVACAEAGHAAEPGPSDRDRVQSRLGLSDKQFTVFLGLLGFWLGDGSMEYRGAKGEGYNAVAFAQMKDSDRAWLRDAIRDVGLPAAQVRSCFKPSGSIETFLILEPRWFSWFDEEFGYKYKRSTRSLQPDASPASRSLSARSSTASLHSTPSSTGRSVERSAVFDYSEQGGSSTNEQDDAACQVCGSREFTTKRNSPMSKLLCDGDGSTDGRPGQQCQSGCHLRCADLDKTPRGEWFCQWCRLESPFAKYYPGRSLSPFFADDKEEAAAMIAKVASADDVPVRYRARSMEVDGQPSGEPVLVVFHAQADVDELPEEEEQKNNEPSASMPPLEADPDGAMDVDEPLAKEVDGPPVKEEEPPVKEEPPVIEIDDPEELTKSVKWSADALHHYHCHYYIRPHLTSARF